MPELPRATDPPRASSDCGRSTNPFRTYVATAYQLAGRRIRLDADIGQRNVIRRATDTERRNVIRTPAGENVIRRAPAAAGENVIRRAGERRSAAGSSALRKRLLEHRVGPLLASSAVADCLRLDVHLGHLSRSWPAERGRA